MLNRICVVCGNEFKPKSPSQKCCSRFCSKVRITRLQSEKREQSPKPKTASVIYEKECEYCATKFTTVNPRQKFCRQKCCQQYHYVRNDKAIKICGNCGKEFETRYRRKKYCCDQCKNEAISKKLVHSYNKNTKTYDSQLCWTCERACGGCSWSESLTPVEGWKAVPSKLEFSGEPGWHILECPLYLKEPEGR